MKMSLLTNIILRRCKKIVKHVGKGKLYDRYGINRLALITVACGTTSTEISFLYPCWQKLACMRWSVFVKSPGTSFAEKCLQRAWSLSPFLQKSYGNNIYFSRKIFLSAHGTVQSKFWTNWSNFNGFLCYYRRPRDPSMFIPMLTPVRRIIKKLCEDQRLNKRVKRCCSPFKDVVDFSSDIHRSSCKYCPLDTGPFRRLSFFETLARFSETLGEFAYVPTEVIGR